MATITEIRPWLGESRIPIEWPVYGSLPPPDADPSELKAELFHITTDDGLYIIDVGWENEGDPAGHYILRVYRNSKFTKPEMRAESRSPEDIRFWTQVALRTVQDEVRRDNAKLGQA